MHLYFLMQREIAPIEMPVVKTDMARTELFTAKDKADRVRQFGYGVPHIDRSTQSATDNLVLVAQNTIQPFRKDKNGVRFNEAHFYQLPWPREILEELDNTVVQLKVTLSYFIEPNPSFASAIDPVRYQSFGLRFDLKRSSETAVNFHKRNNAEMIGDGSRAYNIPDNGWLFGSKSISSGSLHMDIWQGAAVELAREICSTSGPLPDGGEIDQRSKNIIIRHAMRLFLAWKHRIPRLTFTLLLKM